MEAAEEAEATVMASVRSLRALSSGLRCFGSSRLRLAAFFGLSTCGVLRASPLRRHRRVTSSVCTVLARASPHHDASLGGGCRECPHSPEPRPPALPGRFEPLDDRRPGSSNDSRLALLLGVSNSADRAGSSYDCAVTESLSCDEAAHRF